MNNQEYSDLRMIVYLVSGLAEGNNHNIEPPYKKSDILSELWWRFFDTGLERDWHVKRAKGDLKYKLRISEGLNEDSDSICEMIDVTIEELDRMVIERITKVMDKIDDSGDAFDNYMII